MKHFILSCALFAVAATGCQQESVQSAVRSDMLVSTDWLAGNLNDPKLILIHVGQDRGIYDQGHIPGARFLDYNGITATRDGVFNQLPPVEQLQRSFSQLGVGDENRVILMSDMQGVLAARVYWTLDYVGYGDKAALLDGGLEKWKDEGHELSVNAPEVQSGRFSPRLNHQVVVSRQIVEDISWLNVNLEAPDPVLLDARQPEAYRGAMKSKIMPLGGHIPGAVNVYYLDTLADREIPVFKPVEELRRMYAAAGVEPGRKVVTYCWVGMMASHAYFTLKYLGYDVALYDGSFTEWVDAGGKTQEQRDQPTASTPGVHAGM
jgi:thiosulfate/3-mercaptopyruvate sulfurtransferase